MTFPRRSAVPPRGRRLVHHEPVHSRRSTGLARTPALVLIFGLTFEFPVVLVALQLAKVITPQQLSKTRRIAIVAIVVIAGVITPTSDPFSMLALAVPMLVFYEVSILIGRYINRRR